MGRLSKEWIYAAAIRAVKTVAQTAMSMMTIGMVASEIDWATLLSASLVAGLYSVLTSIATGLPATETAPVQGELTIESIDDTGIAQVNLHTYSDLDVAGKKMVAFKVVDLTKEA